MLTITLPDGAKREFPGPVTGAELAASIGPGLAKAALAIKFDGKVRDLSTVIAADAKVSTRTVYNHFENKDALIHAAIISSAEATAQHQIDIVRRLLDAPDDARRALTEFGLVWATVDSATDVHFAMVRQIRADIAHIPPATIDAWQEAGPLRVRKEIAARFQEMHRAGLLALPAQRGAALTAALQFVQLTAGAADRPGQPMSPTELRRLVGSGVHVFLAAYGGDR